MFRLTSRLATATGTLARTQARPQGAMRTAHAARALSSTSGLRKDFRRASPPPLPAEDQAEFERLQREAAVAPPTADAKEFDEAVQALEHPDLRKGPKAEFEGDTNPKTGEVGGPKRDPFVAGNADWQFGGRVTDF